MNLTIRQQFSADFTYSVHFARVNDVLPTILGKAKSLFIIDSNVAKLHPHIHADLVIPGGEMAKNDPTLLQKIYEAIARAELCRHSYVVAIGGGAVLDVVGYAAATAHRGLRLIRVPTTVLSQNDSGLGVKNGINALGKKNFLGTFASPFAVINDESFLETLDDRDWRAGISEAVKVALIKDAEFFGWIESRTRELLDRDMPTMRELIVRCAKLHLDHIAGSGDPFEAGNSRPLDFGHWAAHKLEELTDYTIRHGEAVAMGMAIDANYSRHTGLLQDESLARIVQLIRRLDFNHHHAQLQQVNALLSGIEDFRQHLGGVLTITLLKSIGQSIEVHEIDRKLMLQSIGDLSGAIQRDPQADPPMPCI